MCNVIICFSVCKVINFEINLNFLVKPFSCMTKKARSKIQISDERKGLLRSNKKFLFIFKGLALKQTKQKTTFLEGENSTLR